MSFTKTRAFFVLLCVAVALTVFPLVLSFMGLGNVVKQALQVLSYPFVRCADGIADGIEGFTAYFTEYDRLKAENEQLRAELKEREDRLAEVEEIRSENHWLRRYLQMKNEHIDYILLDVSVIARESTAYATVLTVDRGSLHGVKPGMPVVTPDGVFGYVTEVSPLSSKVLSVVETAVSVGVYTERGGATGLVSGDYLLRADGKVQMTGISADADIRPGDYVYTSGTGSVYPRGLLLGTVESVEADPYARSLRAVIRTAVDFSEIDRISDLMVITDYEVYSEGGDQSAENQLTDDQSSDGQQADNP